MVKELDIKKILKEVLTEADKKSQKRFDGMMEEINDKFKIMEEGFKGVNERFDEIDKTLNSHTEQIANILVDLSSVRLNMQSVSYEVSMHMDKKIDKKHFVDLEGRVRKLEKK